jgi:uncharacterized protein (TIGR03086 family)
MTGPSLRRSLLSCDAQVLEEALRYALTATESVTPGHLARPTPCCDWDLHMLLLHVSESLTALAEGLGQGSIAVRAQPGQGEIAADPVLVFRSKALRLLAVCHARDASDAVPASDVVAVAGCPMATGVLIATGALEIAVHGWDVARACGIRSQIPPALAVELLDFAPMLVTAADREQLFAPPAAVAAAASPGDRLAAFLGRSPHTPASARYG